MIEDLYTYLAADTTLINMIGGSGAERIYPDVSKVNTIFPNIVYNINARGELDEILADLYIQFSIYSKTSLEGLNIEKRLDELLDKQDQIVISSTNYRIFWSKRTSGFTTFENETKLFHRAAIYGFKYIKK